jgi:3-oxoacyl-(acyl-carrier-protein) synthase
MDETGAIEGASRRLIQALEGLEAAAERRRELDRGQQALFSQLHALSDDRAQLASELDSVTARSRGLEAANRDAAQKIDQAIATIRDVLAHD